MELHDSELSCSGTSIALEFVPSEAGKELWPRAQSNERKCICHCHSVCIRVQPWTINHGNNEHQHIIKECQSSCGADQRLQQGTSKSSQASSCPQVLTQVFGLCEHKDYSWGAFQLTFGLEPPQREQVWRWGGGWGQKHFGVLGHFCKFPFAVPRRFKANWALQRTHQLTSKGTRRAV